MSDLKLLGIEELGKAGGARIVLFFNPERGTCRTFEPRVLEAAGRLGLGEFLFGVNTAGVEDAAAAFGVPGVPSLALVVDGRPVEWLFGVHPEAVVLETMGRWKERMGL